MSFIQRNTTIEITIPPKREWLIVALILLTALVPRIYQLNVPSYTWDEVTDREIAWSYLLNGDVTAADREFSQARLPIYLEALVIKYWGDSEISLRSISVGAGMLSLLIIWQIGKRTFGSHAGLLAMTLAAVSPYHLMISRVSGTHGDALLALLYILALWILIEFWGEWKKHAQLHFHRRDKILLLVFGAVAGMATGAKLTGALLGMNLVLVLIASQRAWRNNIRWVILAGVLWLTFFLLTSPIYLHPENIIAAWQDQLTNWEQIRGYQFMGKTYDILPLWYWAAVIPIKFSIPVTLAILFQLIWLCFHRRQITLPQSLLLFNLFPLIILTFRNWQSPTYAVPLIGPFFTLAAQSLTQLGKVLISAWKTPQSRWVSALAALGLMWMIAENGRILAITHPDYLMTGYDFGDNVIGQFWGPAVYHCQGAGQALADLSTHSSGSVLAPQACTGPIAYYQNTYHLPEITFQSQLEQAADVRNYKYVIIPYTVTYMVTPYPLFQDTKVLRDGLARYCQPIYSYKLGARELFWVYDCQPDTTQ
jgi:4-amino-4-deoxy-L-arabinose transferase-like glycosyltransferase